MKCIIRKGKQGRGNDEQGVLNICKKFVKRGELQLSDARVQKYQNLQNDSSPPPSTIKQKRVRFLGDFSRFYQHTCRSVLGL